MTFKKRLEKFKETLALNKFKDVPTSPNGLYDYPNQEVRVPTDGSITMKGIDYPVRGISEQTGEEVVMQPGEEYYFPNTTSVLETPLEEFQSGGSKRQPATRQDSLFLLKNNEKIQKMIDDGYIPVRQTRVDLSNVSQEEWRKEHDRRVNFLDDLIRQDINENQKTEPASQYKDVVRGMTGTQDWERGGGEDNFMPFHYIHPEVAPQYKADFENTAKGGHMIYSFGYDDLALTPFDDLSEREKAERVELYGAKGVPTSYLINNNIPIPPQRINNASNTYTGPTVSEEWQKVTGLPWSEARKIGLTDGSSRANEELLRKLQEEGFLEKFIGGKENNKTENKEPVETNKYLGRYAYRDRSGAWRYEVATEDWDSQQKLQADRTRRGFREIPEEKESFQDGGEIDPVIQAKKKKEKKLRDERYNAMQQRDNTYINPLTVHDNNAERVIGEHGRSKGVPLPFKDGGIFNSTQTKVQNILNR